MEYKGTVKGGVVVLEYGAVLQEGTEVRVEPVGQPQGQTTIGERLMKFAGKAVGLPNDSAKNHDHYLYGTPKK